MSTLKAVPLKVPLLPGQAVADQFNRDAVFFQNCVIELALCNLPGPCVISPKSYFAATLSSVL
jgi:hypothetical protein